MCLLASDKIAVKHVSWNLCFCSFFAHLLMFSHMLFLLSPSHTLTHTLKCWEVPQCCGRHHHHHHHHQSPSRPLWICNWTVCVPVHKPLSRAQARTPVPALALSCWSGGWCTPWRSQQTYSIWHHGPGDCQSGVSHWSNSRKKKRNRKQKKRHNITQKWPQNEWI